MRSRAVATASRQLVAEGINNLHLAGVNESGAARAQPGFPHCLTNGGAAEDRLDNEVVEAVNFLTVFLDLRRADGSSVPVGVRTSKGATACSSWVGLACAPGQSAVDSVASAVFSLMFAIVPNSSFRSLDYAKKHYGQSIWTIFR